MHTEQPLSLTTDTDHSTHSKGKSQAYRANSKAKSINKKSRRNSVSYQSKREHINSIEDAEY